MSGWFSYTGTFLGNQINGVGDFGLVGECPPCEYTITRTWTAEDDCGNMAVATQIIEVSSPFVPTINPDNNPDITDEVTETSEEKAAEGTIVSYPNPTDGLSNVMFNIPEDDSNVSLELYTYKLTTGTNVYISKLVVNK